MTCAFSQQFWLKASGTSFLLLLGMEEGKLAQEQVTFGQRNDAMDIDISGVALTSGISAWRLRAPYHRS